MRVSGERGDSGTPGCLIQGTCLTNEERCRYHCGTILAVKGIKTDIVGFETDFRILALNYMELPKEEKQKLKRLFRSMLENTTMPLESLSLDIFRVPLNELAGRDDWVRISKKDKAAVLSFHAGYDRKSDEYFLTVVKFVLEHYMKSRPALAGMNWDIIYRGQEHKLPGITGFIRKFKQPPRNHDTTLFMKFDLASSSILLDRYPDKFPNIQNRVLSEIHRISHDFETETFMSEGDALYYVWDSAAEDYERHCRNLVFFGMKMLQRMRYFNLLENPLAGNVELKIIGMSLPDTIEDQRAAAREKLIAIEKEHAEAGRLYIDQFIAQKLPLDILSRFSSRTVLREGLLYYYSIDLVIEKVIP